MFIVCLISDGSYTCDPTYKITVDAKLAEEKDIASSRGRFARASVVCADRWPTSNFRIKIT